MEISIFYIYFPYDELRISIMFRFDTGFSLDALHDSNKGSLSLRRSLRSPVLRRFVLAQAIIKFLQLLLNYDKGTILPRS